MIKKGVVLMVFKTLFLSSSLKHLLQKILLFILGSYFLLSPVSYFLVYATQGIYNYSLLKLVSIAWFALSVKKYNKHLFDLNTNRAECLKYFKLTIICLIIYVLLASEFYPNIYISLTSYLGLNDFIDNYAKLLLYILWESFFSIYTINVFGGMMLSLALLFIPVFKDITSLNYKNQGKISEDANQVIRAFKHDVKDHLAVLEELYKSGENQEAEQYMSKILETIDTDKLANSNNFIFDTIINLKLEKLLKSNIDIDIKIDINIASNINILAYDLTIILGNLLENAIDGLINDSNDGNDSNDSNDDKRLLVSINQSMGNIIVFIENSYSGEIIKDNKDSSKLRSTKKYNSKEHGIGLENVKNTLKNYNGELKIDYTSDIFTATAIIPYD